jgi:hypothetical protein
VLTSEDATATGFRTTPERSSVTMWHLPDSESRTITGLMLGNAQSDTAVREYRAKLEGGALRGMQSGSDKERTSLDWILHARQILELIRRRYIDARKGPSMH